MLETKTVTVEYSDEYSALWMRWGSSVSGQDVNKAYREISAYLNTLDQPICVIVDLRENIYMPIKETVFGALFGPYKHPNLGAWLVLGSNAFARSAAATLASVTKQDNVEWFSNELEVKEYLSANCSRLT